MESIEAFDLEDHNSLLPKFLSLVDEIETLGRNDRLSQNYLDLKETWESYASFTILLDHESENIVGFSSLQVHGYPKGYGRVLTRTYYHPSVRENSLAGRKLPSLATRLMLPLQMKKAEELGLEHIFFSMQGLNRRPYFEKVIEALNTHLGIDNWELLSSLYNTCRALPGTSKTNNDQSCWQNIAYFNLGKIEDFKLPELSTDDYLRIYS